MDELQDKNHSWSQKVRRKEKWIKKHNNWILKSEQSKLISANSRILMFKRVSIVPWINYKNLMHFQKTENIIKTRVESNSNNPFNSSLFLLLSKDVVTINNNKYSAWVDNLKKTKSKEDFYYFSIFFLFLPSSFSTTKIQKLRC